MVYRASPSPPGTCPRCRETLLSVERGYGKIAVASVPGVRWCPTCGGVMADVEASRRIVTTLDRDLVEIGFQAGRGKPRRDDDGRKISCPECQFEMVQTHIKAAVCVVDACPTHGTWFDAGELETVTRAFAHARKSGVLVNRVAPDAGGLPRVRRPDVTAEATLPTTPTPEPLSALRDFVRDLLRAAAGD